jgi:hypothetical protein
MPSYPSVDLYPGPDTVPGEEVSMPTYSESILNETKQSLGIAPDVTVFDSEIRLHINSVLGTLNQLGIGPVEGFEIVTNAETWEDFLGTDLTLSPVKTYVHLQVKLNFDPPSNSWATVAIKEQIEELKWRINEAREYTIPIPVDPEDLEDDYVLDGGVI